jgi:hypothetical protein
MMKHRQFGDQNGLRRHSPWLVLLVYLLSRTALAADTPSFSLNRVLERTAGFTSKFLDEFSSVKCSELVTQTKLGKSGKPEYVEEAAFDYLLLAQMSSGELTLTESRLSTKAAKHRRNPPLLVTNGFSTLLLVFHPSYQAGFEFTQLPDEVVGGQRLTRIHFRHIHGMRSTAVLVLRDREYPLDMEGTAWIHPETGMVSRISAELAGSMEDVGLKAMKCEVEYAPVEFRDMHVESWLPSYAEIEVETPRQHWRNVHHFTSYQRFSTSVESKITSTP